MVTPITELKKQAETGLQISPGTQNAQALRVLVQNPEMAFKPKEIAKRAEFPPANAPTVCQRLVEKGVAVNENEHYYLVQDGEIATTARRALVSAHQQEMIQKTVAADEAVVSDGQTDTDPDSLSDAEVEAELKELDDELADL
jgi:hypothetical protein